MNNKNSKLSIILHIPHSSIKIPLKEGYAVSDKELKKEIIKLTDWYTNDLFDHEKIIKVVALFSRIFCDVERFPNDKDEIMSKFGMGMAYTSFDDGKLMRSVDNKLRDKIFKGYYQKHHDEFSKKVEKALDNNGRCLIIDCHSFSNIPFKRDLKKTLKRPNIDIGADKFHTPKKLANIVNKYFVSNGLNCKFNYPYAGSIVPLKYYKKEKRVWSIMIEVNRDLYLEKNTNKKSENYKKVKLLINSLISDIINHY